MKYKEKSELHFLDATKDNIWNYRQNHPELVINDMRSLGYGESIIKAVRSSMLARGINKWLKVRRDLIAYKKLIKHQIRQHAQEIPKLKKEMTDKWVDFSNATPIQIHEYHKARERYLISKELLKYKEIVRADLKTMCMTDRWQIWEGKELFEMNTINASD